MTAITLNRVPAHTAHDINNRIKAESLLAIEKFSREPPGVIELRLAALAREWDIERAIQANASTLMLIGVALGAFVNVWWLLLPAFVGAFLLQHAIQGWCPPVPILRRLGFRTAHEIDAERVILKVLQGEVSRERPTEANWESIVH